MKLTIFCGNEKPFIAVGKNQCNLLDFAYKYQGWHSSKDNRSTQKAIKSLQKNGVILVNEFGQFRINL